ncbi:nitrilase-related carbon-nitrogen hydrolase [Paracoccus zhejiangensis]|uniref:Nitrilase n=1 Tax=Paracoccus zhejiangensis TaxID=1077935 RepID=A0A2H5F518_9RHOB|nr:nitrilase-related carbon-nitrogen hydrolase [Paracoccus zhejiangensis]AUH66640.1 nitrilase [Paracoccus zhejiangensis]
MKLALWQSPPANGRIDDVFSAICQQLRAAAAAGAKLLVAPELILPGYNRPDLHRELAQPLDGEWITRLREMAREAGCGICLGWAERAGEAVYNAATTIGPDGAVLSHYRKIQLFGPMEQASFAHGSQLVPVVSLEDQELATLICYDIEFPGHAAELAAGGARLILVPTANPMGYEHVQRVLVPARAHETGAVVAYANFCGAEGGLTYGGLSVIAGPDGQPLAMAGAYGEALLVVDLAALDSLPAAAFSEQAQEYRPAR